MAPFWFPLNISVCLKPKGTNVKMKRLEISLFLLFCLTLVVACAPTAVADQAPASLGEPVDADQQPHTPTITSAPPISPYSLEALAARDYGQGELTVEYTWEVKEAFTRYKIVYDSDTLTIHGFVNVPVGDGPFPVIIALHGYIPASEYETLDYSTRYADSIARKGYIVLHPNLRNFPPSDIVGRRRDYQSGYVIDVMNLLAHARELAGQDGIFKNADFSRLGVWGHSLGGGTALRLVGLVEEIQAAVLYGAVSQRYTNANTGITIFDYENTNAAFSVHHGVLDDVISVGWSQRLCAQLREAGQDPDCYFYEDQPHTFYSLGEGDALFIQRTIAFFDQHLKDGLD
jgi:dienelactone hydrolase